METKILALNANQAEREFVVAIISHFKLAAFPITKKS